MARFAHTERLGDIACSISSVRSETFDQCVSNRRGRIRVERRVELHPLRTERFEISSADRRGGRDRGSAAAAREPGHLADHIAGTGRVDHHTVAVTTAVSDEPASPPRHFHVVFS
jgi:hypothetical protein